VALARQKRPQTDTEHGHEPGTHNQLSRFTDLIVKTAGDRTMSTRSLALVVVAATLLLAVVALRAQTQTQRPGDTLQLWEYQTEVTRVETRRETGSADAMLNAHGKEGWELVALSRREIRVDDTMQTETLYTFKRPGRTVNR